MPQPPPACLPCYLCSVRGSPLLGGPAPTPLAPSPLEPSSHVVTSDALRPAASLNPPATKPPPCRPALSASFKRALARHQDALRLGSTPGGQREHWQQQDLQQRQQQQLHQDEQEGWGAAGLVCAEDAALQGATLVVSDAADAFNAGLTRYFGASASAPSPQAVGGSTAGGGGRGSSTKAGGDGGKGDRQACAHAVDVTYVALVAAHTWLLQAIPKALQQGGKPRGAAAAASSAPPAAHVLQLLRGLPQLQVRCFGGKGGGGCLCGGRAGGLG